MFSTPGYDEAVYDLDNPTTTCWSCRETQPLVDNMPPHVCGPLRGAA